MFLRKIELHGFKSFAQKTTLEFKGNITAIVGPNGSGKSNISDAVRWVLGEQSPKLLRGKRHEDVIFGGSKNKGRLGMAEVSLFIHNDKKRMPLDYSEVMITRRVYRDGNSEYCINKNKVRLIDISLLLAKAHFGHKSYAVIGQGMIDKIINQLPAERKDFFDEAAGVKEYQIKRDQAVNKLIRTEINLGRANDLISEVEPHLKMLKRQVEKLEKRKSIISKLEEIQVAYYGYLWQELVLEIAELEKQKKLIDPERLFLEAEAKKIREKMELLAREHSSQEAYDDLQREYDGWQAQKNVLIREQAVVEAQMSVEEEKYGDNQVKWIRDRYQSGKDELDQLNNRIENEDKVLQNAEQLLARRLEEQKQTLAIFKEKEYEFLKAKEAAARPSAVSFELVHKKLEAIYQKQSKFIENLYKTNTIDAFKKIKHEAKIITLELADLMDELASKDSKHADGIVRKLEKDLQNYIVSRDNFVNEVSELRIKISSIGEKKKILEYHRSQKQNETEKLQKEILRHQKITSEKDTKLPYLQKETEAICKKIHHHNARIETIKKRIDAFNAEQGKKRALLVELQNELSRKQENISALSRQCGELDVRIARFETRRDDLSMEIQREISSFTEAIKKAKGFSRPILEDSRLKIERYKKQLEFIGGIDPDIIHEYEEVSKRHDFLSGQYQDLVRASKDLEKIIDALDATIKKHFDASFHLINKNFDKYFKILFNGGSAKLSIVQEAIEDENPLNEGGEPDPKKNELEFTVGIQKKRQKVISGVNIIVHLPGKKILDISSLSGGEKTLTAMSLISAIISSNPPPFVFFDEVDAALDEANSDRFSNIMDHLSDKTQFIMITHNRAIMKRADVLYGVTMNEEGMSRLLAVKLADINDKVIGNSRKNPIKA